MKEIESRRILNRNNNDYDTIVQIIDASIKFLKFTLNSSECAQNKITLQVIDNNSYFFPLHFLAS